MENKTRQVVKKIEKRKDKRVDRGSVRGIGMAERTIGTHGERRGIPQEKGAKRAQRGGIPPAVWTGTQPTQHHRKGNRKAYRPRKSQVALTRKQSERKQDLDTDVNRKEPKCQF